MIATDVLHAHARACTCTHAHTTCMHTCTFIHTHAPTCPAGAAQVTDGGLPPSRAGVSPASSQSPDPLIFSHGCSFSGQQLPSPHRSLLPTEPAGLWAPSPLLRLPASVCPEAPRDFSGSRATLIRHPHLYQAPPREVPALAGDRGVLWARRDVISAGKPRLAFRKWGSRLHFPEEPFLAGTRPWVRS